jgi:hypothetical protein
MEGSGRGRRLVAVSCAICIGAICQKVRAQPRNGDDYEKSVKSEEVGKGDLKTSLAPSAGDPCHPDTGVPPDDCYRDARSNVLSSWRRAPIEKFLPSNAVSVKGTIFQRPTLLPSAFPAERLSVEAQLVQRSTDAIAFASFPDDKLKTLHVREGIAYQFMLSRGVGVFFDLDVTSTVGLNVGSIVSGGGGYSYGGKTGVTVALWQGWGVIASLVGSVGHHHGQDVDLTRLVSAVQGPISSSNPAAAATQILPIAADALIASHDVRSFDLAAPFAARISANFAVQGAITWSQEVDEVARGIAPQGAVTSIRRTDFWSSFGAGLAAEVNLMTEESTAFPLAFIVEGHFSRPKYVVELQNAPPFAFQDGLVSTALGLYYTEKLRPLMGFSFVWSPLAMRDRIFVVGGTSHSEIGGLVRGTYVW